MSKEFMSTVLVVVLIALGLLVVQIFIYSLGFSAGQAKAQYQIDQANKTAKSAQQEINFDRDRINIICNRTPTACEGLE